MSGHCDSARYPVDRQNHHDMEVNQMKEIPRGVPMDDFGNGKNASSQSRALPAIPLISPKDDCQCAREMRSRCPSAAGLDTNHSICIQPRTTAPPNTDVSKKSNPEQKRNASLVEAALSTKEKLEESQQNCEVLQAKVIELQKDLWDAQDFILSLRPLRRNLTETEATEDFSALCLSIAELVDRKLVDALDDWRPREKNLEREPAKLLLSMIPYPGKEAFKYPETDEHNICAAIMEFLRIHIFNRTFYIPLEPRDLKLMEAIEQSMRRLEPRRDNKTCRSWHCETYTAIASIPEVQQIRKIRQDSLIQELVAMLRIFIPQADMQRLEIQVRDSIIEPAFSLAHKMHLSVDYFDIEWSPYHESGCKDPGSLAENYDSFEFHDLVSRKTLKAIPSGSIQYLFDITPRLVIRTVKADEQMEPKVLKRSKILVAVNKQGHSFFKEPLNRQESDVTALGWLEKKLHPSSRARQRY